MSSILRSMARSRAKENMKAKGYRKFCKHSQWTDIQGFKHIDPSTFAERWREFANFVTIDVRKRGVKA